MVLDSPVVSACRLVLAETGAPLLAILIFDEVVYGAFIALGQLVVFRLGHHATRFPVGIWVAVQDVVRQLRVGGGVAHAAVVEVPENGVAGFDSLFGIVL